MRGVLLVDSLEDDIRRLVLGRELSGFIPSAGFMLDPPPFDSGAHSTLSNSTVFFPTFSSHLILNSLKGFKTEF
jgi:hypothetical protein